MIHELKLHCRPKSRGSGNVHVNNNSRRTNFRGVKFSRFHSIREIFSTVDSYNMEKRLESS